MARDGALRNVRCLSDRQCLNADQIKTTTSIVIARMGNRCAATVKLLNQNQSAKNPPATTGRAIFTGRCQGRLCMTLWYTTLE